MIRVLYDSYSKYSFVQRLTTERLKQSEHGTLPLTVHTFGCDVVQKTFPICSIEMKSLLGSLIKSIDVVFTDHLVYLIRGHQIDLSRYPHLKSLSIRKNYSSCSLMGSDELIGANFFHDFVLHKRRRGSRNEPIAVKTVLVWTLHGPYLDLSHLHDKPDPSISFFSDLTSVTKPSLSDDIERLWSLEAINILSEPEPVGEASIKKRTHLHTITL